MTTSAVTLLKSMIAIPSFSFHEDERSNFLYNYLIERGALSNSNIVIERIKNNIIAYSREFCINKKTLMLTSHIDTVEPVSSYTFNALEPFERDGIVYGLGTNDDGASVVSQIEVFFHFYGTPKQNSSRIPINLLLVLTAEEERSGQNGMDLALEKLATKSIINNKGEQLQLMPHFAIMGEPTGMDAAIAERGLLVLDCYAKGVSGHAAREEGINALYIAIDDIKTLQKYNFTKVSPLMGNVKLSITQLNSGVAHNVVPDSATFVVDIRPTEQYTNTEILELLQKEVKSTLKPRNLTNKSSATPTNHLLQKTIGKLGIKSYVSPTTSDWMRVHIPAIKMGPGESARSHRADEFIKISEIEGGIKGYINFIENIKDEHTLE